ncbi:MAG: DUF1501 domain-containing protein [Isosphaeraceae bacterium]
MLSLLAANGALGISRRRFLQVGLAGSAAAGVLPSAISLASRSHSGAKHCIYIYLCGGPSQHDLWDPKPDAPAEIRSEFRPIETNVPGIWFTELIPNVARHADKLAVIRSMTHGWSDHNAGSAYTLIGHRPGRPDDVFVAPADHPALGAILHRLRGETGLLPPWVILPRPFTTASPPIKGQSGGFLGSGFDAVALDETKRDSLAPKDLRFSAFDLPPGVGRARVHGRRELLSGHGAQGEGGRSERHESRWDSILEKASAMLVSEECTRAFDLTREDPRLRDRYGRNEYGQSFLLARRLVEAGVRFVNVFWTYFDEQGCQFNLWDNHGVATDVCGTGGVRTGRDMLKHRYCTPSFDRAFPALLEDLERRGLLDETLVVVAGEFGRTPKINQTAGRDHWPYCYSQLLAGGGVRGGQVHGASDRHGAYVKDRPVRPEDFHATILHAFALSPETILPDHLGRPIRISEGQPVTDLFS